MNVAIIGHGPSMLGGFLGKEIDEHDKVIRLKRCQDTLKYPGHYGRKVSAVCGSLTIGAHLKNIPADGYWVFADSRHKDQDINLEAYKEHFSPKPVIIDRKLCDEWNERYRDLRTEREFPDTVELKKSSTDKLGEDHLSAGLHAVLYAAKHLKPERIDLFGFDNVFTRDYGWSITRGPEWDKYPPHRWDIEKDLLNDIEQEFDTEIHFVFP